MRWSAICKTLYTLAYACTIPTCIRYQSATCPQSLDEEQCPGLPSTWSTQVPRHMHKALTALGWPLRQAYVRDVMTREARCTRDRAAAPPGRTPCCLLSTRLCLRNGAADNVKQLWVDPNMTQHDRGTATAHPRIHACHGSADHPNRISEAPCPCRALLQLGQPPRGTQTS
jgi:hypothetical protein